MLYQGGLMTARGIEQAMDAILEVPGAVLVLLGFGALRDWAREQCATDAASQVADDAATGASGALLAWTASADVSVMAIQPTSVNHLYSTPQKLFESIAAGVPVVASDLPGMARYRARRRGGPALRPDLAEGDRRRHPSAHRSLARVSSRPTRPHPAPRPGAIQLGITSRYPARPLPPTGLNPPLRTDRSGDP